MVFPVTLSRVEVESGRRSFARVAKVSRDMPVSQRLGQGGFPARCPDLGRLSSEGVFPCLAFPSS